MSNSFPPDNISKSPHWPLKSKGLYCIFFRNNIDQINTDQIDWSSKQNIYQRINSIKGIYLSMWNNIGRSVDHYKMINHFQKWFWEKMQCSRKLIISRTTLRSNNQSCTPELPETQQPDTKPHALSTFEFKINIQAERTKGGYGWR